MYTLILPSVKTVSLDDGWPESVEEHVTLL